VNITCLIERGFNFSISMEGYYPKTDTYNRTEINDLIPSLLTFYFHAENASFNGELTNYTTMNLTHVTYTNSTIIISVQDTQVIAYRLNMNTNLTQISGGVIRGHIFVTKTTGTKDVQIYGEVYKKHRNGSEVLITTTGLSPILVDGIGTNIDISATVVQQELNITDMLLWKLRASVSGFGTDPTLNVTIGGDYASGIDLPISLSQFFEIDPIWVAARPIYNYSLYRLSQFENDVGYITSYTTDGFGILGVSSNSCYLNITNGSNAIFGINDSCYYANGFLTKDNTSFFNQFNRRLTDLAQFAEVVASMLL